MPLLLQGSLVPLAAELATTADVGLHIHPALLQQTSSYTNNVKHFLKGLKTVSLNNHAAPNVAITVLDFEKCVTDDATVARGQRDLEATIAVQQRPAKHVHG
jgi:hypothetical protein